jgi:hypothetical protein
MFSKRLNWCESICGKPPQSGHQSETQHGIRFPTGSGRLPSTPALTTGKVVKPEAAKNLQSLVHHLLEASPLEGIRPVQHSEVAELLGPWPSPLQRLRRRRRRAPPAVRRGAQPGFGIRKYPEKQCKNTYVSPELGDV